MRIRQKWKSMLMDEKASICLDAAYDCPAVTYQCGCGKLNRPLYRLVRQLSKKTGIQIMTSGQVFPEQVGRMLDFGFSGQLKYCWNFYPSNCSSLTRLWYTPC